MKNEYTPSQKDIDAAWQSSEERLRYTPVQETITVQFETSQSFKLNNGDCYPFIRLTAIPERFHEAVRQLSRGSTCPAIDSERNTFYTHDVYRWLRAIGVEAEFVEPKE
jgi:hypothetical protein